MPGLVVVAAPPPAVEENGEEEEEEEEEEAELVSQRRLFGGSISCSFPARFQDVSDIRDVPSNQEVFVDPNRDESVIVELLELKTDVSDRRSASWFLADLAHEQDSKDDLVVEAGRDLSSSEVPLLDPSTPMNSAIGTLCFLHHLGTKLALQAVAKAREGVEACNSVRVYLANLRLQNVQTDLLITLYEPLVISVLAPEHPLSCIGAREEDFFQLCVVRTISVYGFLQLGLRWRGPRMDQFSPPWDMRTLSTAQLLYPLDRARRCLRKMWDAWQFPMSSA